MQPWSPRDSSPRRPGETIDASLIGHSTVLQERQPPEAAWHNAFLETHRAGRHAEGCVLTAPGSIERRLFEDAKLDWRGCSVGRLQPGLISGALNEAGKIRVGQLREKLQTSDAGIRQTRGRNPSRDPQKTALFRQLLRRDGRFIQALL